MIVKVARNIQLRNYTGEDNPKAWMKQFLKYCARTDLAVSDYLDEARDYLQGRALAWYERNYDKFEDNFDIFRNMFFSAFFKDPSIIETQLLLTRQNAEEDLKSFLKRLENIAKPACIDEPKIR